MELEYRRISNKANVINSNVRFMLAYNTEKWHDWTHIYMFCYISLTAITILEMVEASCIFTTTYNNFLNLYHMVINYYLTLLFFLLTFSNYIFLQSSSIICNRNCFILNGYYLLYSNKLQNNVAVDELY